MHIALVFSGGIGLGAYQGGAYAALHAQHSKLDWLAGSSVGAVNAAVIAGNCPEDRIERLRTLWMIEQPWRQIWQPPASAGGAGAVRHLQNWTSAIQTRLLGRAGHFVPRYMAQPFQRFASLYDLTPLRTRIEQLVDFDRLNNGDVRYSVALTDIESGEAVIFDTARGDRIELDHLLASCGFLPEFAPLDIGGRLLGDGGLSINAPVEAVLLDERDSSDRTCLVVDLFARDGARPTGLETALARKNDLIFANQTWKRLQALQHASKWRDQAADLARRLPSKVRNGLDAVPRRTPVRAVLYLAYRARPDEAGPEKQFDLSRATVADRWLEGELDMARALQDMAGLPPSSQGFSLRSVRREERADV